LQPDAIIGAGAMLQLHAPAERSGGVVITFPSGGAAARSQTMR